MDIENSQSGPKNMASVGDDGLYALCKQYGERARIWRQRFAGLLPEVFRRKLYEKKGFISIFEFAKKLAGMSEEQVRLVLNLEKRFEQTPTLKTLLTSGKVSINKLARVVSIVTPENEKFLAMQVQILSKNAVETLVRDEKFARENIENPVKNKMDFYGRNVAISEKHAENMTKNACTTAGLFEGQNGLFEPPFDAKSLPEQTQSVITLRESQKTCALIEESRELYEPQDPAFKTSCDKSPTLNLSAEIQEKLIELQQKGININELLKEFLQKREEEIAQRKEEISQKISGERSEKITTRYIPIPIKKILQQEHGTKCSMKNCQKPSEQIHHIQRFSVAQSHDPHYLAPLCKAHHELAHSADMAYRSHKIK